MEFEDEQNGRARHGDGGEVSIVAQEGNNQQIERCDAQQEQQKGGCFAPYCPPRLYHAPESKRGQNLPGFAYFFHDPPIQNGLEIARLQHNSRRFSQDSVEHIASDRTEYYDAAPQPFEQARIEILRSFFVQLRLQIVGVNDDVRRQTVRVQASRGMFNRVLVLLQIREGGKVDQFPIRIPGQTLEQSRGKRIGGRKHQRGVRAIGGVQQQRDLADIILHGVR